MCSHATPSAARRFISSDQPACLGLGIGEAHHLDRHADRLGRPQRLAEPALVLGDHRVGGGQDVPGGAEVLLQPHLPGLREVVREAADILDVRASKPVHRLVVVSHDEDLAVPGREQAQPRVLGGAHVLVFVRQHAVEAAGPALPVGRVALHGHRRPQQQVAEVGGVRLAQAALVLGVDPRHQAQAVRVHRTVDQARLGDPGLHPGRRLLRRHQVVLELADLPAHQLDRVAVAAELGRVHRHRLEHALDQPLAVVRVQDVEAGAQARHLRLGAQLAGAEAVEGAAPGWHRLPGQHAADALGHLARGLVGEGHGQDAAGGDAPGLDAPGDAGGQGLGLAGARTRQHQHGAGKAGRLCLRRGQASQDGGGSRNGRLGREHVTGPEHGGSIRSR